MLIKDDERFGASATAADPFAKMDDDEKRSYFIGRYLTSRTNQKVLYFHTPFCPVKCRFCHYHSERLDSDAQLKEFVHSILPFQAQQFDLPLRQTTFDQVYFGGGTPTIMDADMMAFMFNLIPRFDGIPVKCVESSPSTLTTEHAELFRDRGFNFVSVGVQSLNELICQKWGRPHVTRDELLRITSCLAQFGLYLNIDLICFMGERDVRDLPDFAQDLSFVLDECQPQSVTVHQLSQSSFSPATTGALIETLREMLEQHPGYVCANSLLQDADRVPDSVYEAEYRFTKRQDSFSHYMWGKYSGLPIEGYDILSLGYLPDMPTASNAGDLLYLPNSGQLSHVQYHPFWHRDYLRIRRELGFDTGGRGNG